MILLSLLNKILPPGEKLVGASKANSLHLIRIKVVKLYGKHQDINLVLINDFNKVSHFDIKYSKEILFYCLSPNSIYYINPK